MCLLFFRPVIFLCPEFKASLLRHIELLFADMPYSYNRNAFRAALSVSTLPPLLGAYTSLVTLELFLKEHLPRKGLICPIGHDVPEMLKTLARSLPGVDRSVINSIALSLGGRLGDLWCEGVHGGPVRVQGDKYPYIRYIRHGNDWVDHHSTDADVASVQMVAAQAIHRLKRVTGLII